MLPLVLVLVLVPLVLVPLVPDTFFCFLAAVFLSSCKGPESTNACDAPTNLKCDTTEDHCKCKPNTWLSNFNPGVICYNEAQLRARGEWNGR